ncbi:MAG: preprotein translocase subunit SecY [Bdellovibrionaceae bacterium]|nr:preprotein translocase subunit SecY [Pseudobdellovibrionaceae bacterium]MDW8190884.1 preprotein translocase subunit SecY [Pseudobdellovibrionaceae bacterium]
MNKESSVIKRIVYVLWALALYRVGVHISVPGVDGAAVERLFAGHRAGVLGIFDTFSGGALAQFSILALGIMPYISASIIMQLLSASIPSLEALKKEGPAGRKRINRYTKMLTLLLCIIQGYGLTSWIANSSGPSGESLVSYPSFGGIPFVVVAIFTLTAGSFFLMWLGEQITEKGIGNGTSLIIFTGIASSLPQATYQFFELIGSGELTPVLGLVALLIFLGVLIAVVVMETAQRRLPIQYSQRIVGIGPTNHLPLKINFSGVIPPIFASSMLLFPATLTQFVDVGWLKNLQNALNPNGVIYNIFFVVLIVFFSFFYMEVVFNPKDVAENLKKQGGFIPGVRAGSATSDYIKKIMFRIGTFGAIYLSVICVLPVIFMNSLSIPFYFGGTSLLILVGVALDTAQQIQAAIMTERYESFSKTGKIRSRRIELR